MSFGFPTFAIAYVFTAGVSIVVTFIAWRRRATPGGLSIALLMIAVTEWALTAALEIGALGIPAKVLWSKIEYLGTVSSPTLFLIFALQYTRRDKWLTRRNVALLWVIPIITQIMAATNDWHGLIWNSFTPSPAGNNLLIYGHGTWFWIAITYFYASVFVGTLALIRAVIRSPNLYRQQASALLLGALAPWLGNVLYVFGLIPIPGLDPTPIAFGLTGLLISWGIFRYQLFDLVPVARDVLIENMSDGVLVLDEQNRIVDINTAAQRLTGLTSSAIGQCADTALSMLPGLTARFRDARQAQTETLVSKDQSRYLDLHISPLHDRRGRFTGRIIVFRDITIEKQVYAEARQRAERLALINEISMAINLSGEVQTVLQAAADGLASVLNVSQTGIALFDETRQHLTVTAYHAAPGNISAVGVELPIEGNLSLQHILSNRQPLTIEDARTDALMASVREVMVQQRIQSILLAPLIVRGKVVGTIGCGSIETSHQFTPEEIELAQTVANLAALRIEQARLFEAERIARQQAQQRARGLSGLYAITRATSRSLALEDVLTQALSSAVVSLEYEAGLIALADPGEPSSGLRLVAERGLPAVVLRHLQASNLDGTLIAYTRDQREIVLIDDLEQEQSADLRAMAAETGTAGWSAFIGIPLLQQEQSLGAMCLLARHPHSAASHDLALLTSIGRQVATAVTNAQLFQTTLNERSRLKALIESSRDGIVLSNMDGQILIVNAPALQMLQLSGQPDDWLRTELRVAMSRSQEFASEGSRVAMAEIGRPWTGDEPPTEGQLEVPPRVIRWHSLPVKVGVRHMGRLFVLRDMTEERALERMREDMTHTMVHDLRNPLGSISASLELLTEGALGKLAPDQLDVLEIAQRGAKRMLELVNAILDVSRLESGRMPIEPDVFSVAVLAADVIRAQAAVASKKNIRLESRVPSTLPFAWADVNLIQRVLQNLIGNAIKFTPSEGTVSVTARVEVKDQQPVIVVSVSDTGPGISSEIMGQLFHKFVTGRQEERGSGLGLAFCKLVVEAHGGRIWVDSSPTRGSTFTFTLNSFNVREPSA